MSNFWTRTLTGLVLITGIVLLILIGGAGLMLLSVLIDVIGLTEFYSLNKVVTSKPQRVVAISSSLIMLICVFATRYGHNLRLLLLIIPAIFLLFTIALFQKEIDPLPGLGVTLMGWCYITLPLGLLICLAYLPLPGKYHADILLGYFMMLWAADSGAYVTGKLVGRHPLFRRISPGKTWEGSIGGAVLALAAAWLNSRWFGRLCADQWFEGALIIVITGTFGDLFKSLLKRTAQVKDTGNILPGHGGILDRFDSLLGSAPYLFALLILSQ